MSSAAQLPVSRQAPPQPARLSRIKGQLRELFGQLLGVERQEIDAQASFLELGADSLLLLQASQQLRSNFGVRVPFRDLLEGLPTLQALSEHLDQELPPDEALQQPPAQASSSPPPGGRSADDPSPLAPPAPSLWDAPSGNGRKERLPDGLAEDALGRAPLPEAAEALDGTLEEILSFQLQILERQLQVTSQQIDLLGQAGPWLAGTAEGQTVAAPGAAARRPAEPPRRSEQGGQEERSGERKPFEPKPYVAHKPARVKPGALSPRQQAYVERLAGRLGRRHLKSKRLAQQSRPVLADSRNSKGFRLLHKELLYPIFSERASGARVWDIDGNEYLDLNMGYGTLVFGHSPAFIVEALRKQSLAGLQIGLESPQAARAAELICELTGNQRAAFFNSGTEAVMAAIRLARTRTGRDKFVMFQGGYHGFHDEVLAVYRGMRNGRPVNLPMAPGVPSRITQDVMVLPYCKPESVEFIKECAHELAAVILEPQQSRRPGMNTESFLKELSKATREAGIALILDEMVTGFRAHPGGVQALSGIRADIVTYGKGVGAGVPVGVVSGKAQYLDGLDGGMWNYGDDSYPRAESTFMAGTYFAHPLTMPAVCAVLKEYKRRGPQLQEEMNRKTGVLAERLNEYLIEEKLPIRMIHWGSMCRPVFAPELKHHNLFYYSLLEQGLYVRDGRPWYLSAAHTDEDVDEVVRAVRAAVEDLQEGGFLPSPAGTPQTPESAGAAGQEAREAPPKAYRMPATEAQKELWTLAQISPDASRAYNEGFKISLGGRLRVDALRGALRQLVCRHDILRASFSPLGDQLCVAPQVEAGIPVQDLSWLGGETLAAEADRLTKAAVNQTFDFLCGPLFRFRLIRLGEDCHILTVTFHHSISDGISNGMLLGETAHLYRAMCRGEADRLAQPVPYRKFVEWQKAWQEGERLADAEAFWLAQFSDSVPILDLPGDRPRPALKSYAGSQRQMRLSADLYSSLKQSGAKQGGTLFSTLLAAVQILLHRLSGQEDIVVGTASAGQLLMGGRPSAGHSINLLPVRSRIDGDHPFSAFLAQSRKSVLDAHEHQNYPFHRLVRRLNLPPDTSRSPLVSVVMNLDRHSSGKLQFFELETATQANPSQAAKFDLLLDISPKDSGLYFHCEFNSDLFDRSTVQRWLSHLRSLLQGIADGPERPLSALPLLSRGQRHQLVREWNGTRCPFPQQQGLQGLFEAQAASRPDAAAVLFGDALLSCRELDRRANQTARRLGRAGLGPESLAGVFMERSLEMVVSLYSILKAGAAYLPLDPSEPSERLGLLLQDAAPQIVLTQQEFRPKLEGFQFPVLCLDSDWQEIASQEDSRPDRRLSPDSLAYVIYTSGSTGRPKGVAIAQRGICNRLHWMQRAYELGVGDRVAQKTPYTFDVSVWEFFWPLLYGASLAVLRPEGHKDPDCLADFIREQGVTTLHFVPSMLRAFAEHPEVKECASIRRVICSGEALGRELAERFQALLPVELHNLYGPTEASVDVTSWDCRASTQAQGVPIGRPIDNTRIHLLDKALLPVPVGAAGELCIGGVNLARCYRGRPALTADRFIPDPMGPPGSRLYRTGDQARHLPDGSIEFLGRLDFQVKVRGFRIELGEIEARLRSHPSVADAVVAAIAHEPGDLRLIAYAVGPEADLDPVSLRAFLKERLPGYMLPSAYVALGSLPLTPSGKVDRKALPQPDSARPVLEAAFVKPWAPQETQLAEIWQEMLGLEKVGIHDNFFELGGDSILAIRSVVRAKEAGLHLTPAQILQMPTIAELAEAAVAAPETQAQQGPVTGPVPLTPVQRWFFERSLRAPHHFNQFRLLEVHCGWDLGRLRQALGIVLNHHDALRLRFQREETGWRQVCAPAGEKAPFTRFDFSGLPDHRHAAVLDSAASQLQAGLNLRLGPLCRLAHFALGPGKPARLLFIVHHLAVDIHSWWILLNDLTDAWRRLEDGGLAELPPKTTSYQQWARRLEEHSSSEELRQELDFWLKQGSRREAQALPVDLPGLNSMASARLLFASLSAEQTRLLEQQASQSYRADVREAVLTALAQSFAEWTGKPWLLVDMEEHGREEIFSGFDLTRTVGWFTSVYPLLLELDEGRRLGGDVKAVKQQLRAVPSKGIGYGLLRHCRAGGASARRLASLPQPQVLFNFTGRSGGSPQAGEEAVFRACSGSAGPAEDARQQRSHLFEIDAGVRGGQLRFTWRYSKSLHRTSTVERLAQGSIRALQRIIQQGPSAGKDAYAKSDFPAASLSQQDLEKLIGKIG